MITRRFRSVAVPGLLALLSIWQGSLRGATWQQTSAPTFYWQSIACSADGARLVVAAPGGYPDYAGPIYTSTNAGLTWEANGAAPVRQLWSGVGSSADGTTLVVVSSGFNEGLLPGAIYVSTNSGGAWNGAGSGYCRNVASCATGSSIVCAARSPTPRQPDWNLILISTNSTTTFAASSLPLDWWNSVAVSASGTTMFATTVLGTVYRSTNSGIDWVSLPLTNAAIKVACSADARLVAAVASPGPIFVSRDYGATWEVTGAPVLSWSCVAASADGKRLVAASNGPGFIYISEDSGQTWNLTTAPDSAWASVACSADGTRLYAASSGIYTWQTTPHPALTANKMGGSLTLSWLTASSHFILQQTSSLAHPEWTDVDIEPGLNYTNLHQEVSLSVPSGPVFYRLVSR